MPIPGPPDNKRLANRKESAARSPFVLRLDRAAEGVNPFLVVLMIGLMILDLILYLGTAAAQQPFVMRAAHQIGSTTTGTVPLSTDKMP
jgi:hypothetical protein